MTWNGQWTFQVAKTQFGSLSVDTIINATYSVILPKTNIETSEWPLNVTHQACLMKGIQPVSTG